MNAISKIAVTAVTSAVLVLSLSGPVLATGSHDKYDKKDHDKSHYDKKDDHKKKYEKKYKDDICEEKPEKPEKPHKPEQPPVVITPEEPETPEVPETPETPEVPEQPETPVVPVTPEEPEVEAPKPEAPKKDEMPEEIPSTGAGAALSAIVGASALAGSTHAYLRSRRIVK